MALFAALSLSAQEKNRFNPDQTWNTLRAEYGFLLPMDSSMASSDAYLSLTYTRQFSRHWGWRTGIQYDTEMMSVQDHVGVPVAAVFRTGNEVSLFFRRIEGYVGVTPGYVFGHDNVYRYGAGGRNPYEEGIRLNRRFTLTADLGFTYSIPIWRFSLDLTSSIHYLPTGNFSEYHQDFDPLTDRPVGQAIQKPLRWQGSIGIGLSYLF